MSEQTVAEGIQDVIQALATFANGDVVINDWTILDGSISASPYVIIETSDDFRSLQGTSESQEFWNIKVTLFEAFTADGLNGWQDCLTNFRNTRQAILDTFNAAGDNRAADGLASTDIAVIRNEGPITPYYDPGIPPEQYAEEDPIFLYQTIIFETEEY